MPLSRLVPLSETQEDSPSYALRAALAQRLSAHRASAREAALRLDRSLPLGPSLPREQSLPAAAGPAGPALHGMTLTMPR